MSILKWFQNAAGLTVVALVVPVARGAQEGAVPPAIVTRTCSGCHGVDGRSQLRYVPRLAGLSAEYLEHKLQGFRAAASAPVDEAISRVVRTASGSRDQTVTAEASAHMVGLAHGISDRDLKAAAQWYSAQPPAPAKGGTGKDIEFGKSLFAEGLKSKGIQACQTCHGADAQGTSIAPRLAGQNAAYLMGQLALFRATADPNRSLMISIARSMEDDQVRAIAQYLQSR